MKKFALLAAFAMVAAPAFALWPDDPAGTLVQPIPGLMAAPTVDGDEADAAWALVPWTQFNVTKTWDGGADFPDDAADWDGYFKAGHYDNKLYFLFKVTDDVWEENSGVWNDDSVEIYIDVQTTQTPGTGGGHASKTNWIADGGPSQLMFFPDMLAPLTWDPDGDDQLMFNDAGGDGVVEVNSDTATYAEWAVGGFDTEANQGSAGTVYFECALIFDDAAGIDLSTITDPWPFMVAANDMDGGALETFPAWWGVDADPWNYPPADAGGDNPAQWNDPTTWSAAVFPADTDGDFVPDAWETNTGTYVGPDDTGTDPAVADSDGDMWSDGAEIAAGTDPTDPDDSPAGMPPGVPAVSGLGLALLGAALVAARKIRG